MLNDDPQATRRHLPGQSDNGIAGAVGGGPVAEQAGHPGAGRSSSLSGTRRNYPRELQAGGGELHDPVSLPWRGLAFRLIRRPGQRGQHHAATGSFLGRLDQEFL